MHDEYEITEKFLDEIMDRDGCNLWEATCTARKEVLQAGVVRATTLEDLKPILISLIAKTV
jgi:hypothetical protein